MLSFIIVLKIINKAIVQEEVIHIEKLEINERSFFLITENIIVYTKNVRENRNFKSMKLSDIQNQEHSRSSIKTI